MTPPTPRQHLTTQAPVPIDDDPVAVVRGLLAQALRRCAPTSDAALELCAAWEHLEEPDEAPDACDVDLPDDVPATAILPTAQDVLADAILTVQPARRALALAAAARHIRTAMADLADVGPVAS